MAAVSGTSRRARRRAPRSAPRYAATQALSFLEGRLDALVDRSIEIAKQNGYAPFTTTIRAAWVEAIVSVTESLGNYLSAAADAAPGPQATRDYQSDPRFARMRLIARQHRSLGITLPMYIGLFKHFRNIYIEELDALPGGAPPGLAKRVCDFFDETELSVSADWNHPDDNVRLREMQERARAITLDKDRYFAIFESLRNPAFLLDKAHNLVNANEAAAELFLGDAHAGEIIYLRSMRQRKNSLQTVTGRIMAAVTDADRSVWLETLGGERCFDVRMRALHDAVENIPIGHVVLLNDVTEHRRATEQAQRAERGMSRFLATMSHEIRTPLHSVLGATELLRTADAATAESYLDLIENAGQTLLQTLSNVLDYSKLQNEPPKPRPAATDLAAAVAAFARVAAVGRDREMGRLDVEVDAGLPEVVLIDWAMTQQILSNLVSNALRVDDGRGVGVRIFETARVAGRRRLRFEVRDHGPGIPDDDAEALFQPFEKTSARNTGGGGAGLGLAISHHLAEAMGGRIGYRNRAHGALVWFETPFEPCAAQPAGDSPAQPPAVACAALRCLLVDDDPIGGTVTMRQLQRLGLRVERAPAVAEARRAVARAAFDVFVVDYTLPDGDGPSLVGELRECAGAGSRFIALTANVEALERRDDLKRLFDAILAKPADQSALSAAIHPVVGVGEPDEADDGVGVAPSLEGLSLETVRAMADAFEDAWREFREMVRRADDAADLAYHAHKLAGSSAFLGLRELEAPLRDFERRCREEGAAPTGATPAASLDLDLSELSSWSILRDAVARS